MIHIIDDWYMTADRFCYTVGRLSKRKGKDGSDESCLKDPTYHGTVANALRSVLQDSVRDKIAKDKITNLAEVLTVMEKYNNRLIKQFDKAEKELESKRRPASGGV